jgi:hypothetical protein
MHIENMSIRAHRIISIKYAPDTTFNCWHDNALFEFLLENNTTNDDGIGVIDVSVERLKEALTSPDLSLGDDVREGLETDIAWAKTQDRDYINYDCF